MAFVLVQHLDPEHESALTQLLAKTTSMLVSEVTNWHGGRAQSGLGDTVEYEHDYCARPFETSATGENRRGASVD